MDYNPTLLLFIFLLKSFQLWPSRLLSGQLHVPAKSLYVLLSPSLLAGTNTSGTQSIFPAPVPESTTSPKTLEFRTLSNYTLETITLAAALGDGWSLSIEADRPAGSLPQLKNSGSSNPSGGDGREETTSRDLRG